MIVAAGLTRETLTVFAAILAASIGFFAYSWQKAVDTEREIMRETRALLLEFIECSKRVDFSQPMIGGVDGSEKMAAFKSLSGFEADFYILRDKLFVIAPAELVSSIIKHDDAMRA
jgi:hypothetical protein